MSVPRIVVRQPTLQKPGRVEPASRRSPPRFQWVLDAWDGLFLDDLCGGYETARIRDIHASLFREGYGYATVVLVVAVLVNHVRRMLAPWLGGFLFSGDLVAGMKMARSSPHVFVQQSLGFPWSWLFIWLGVSYLVQAVSEPLAEMAAGPLLSPPPPSLSSSPSQPPASPVSPLSPSSWSRGQLPIPMRGTGVSAPVWQVLWVTLILAGGEHAYAHACWAAAQLYAHGTLMLRAGAEEQAILQSVLDGDPVRAMALLALVVWGLHHYLVPMATKLPRGRFVAGVMYAVLAAGTAWAVKYSGYYFIALEVSDMLVTFGWLAVVLAVVAVEMLRERLLGKKGSVRRGGRRGGKKTTPSSNTSQQR